EPARDARRGDRGNESSHASKGDREADHARRETQLADEKDDDDRERDVREEVRGRGATGLRTEVRIAEDEAEALLQLCPHARLLPYLGRRVAVPFALSDAEDEGARSQEARGVGEYRVRGRE